MCITTKTAMFSLLAFAGVWMAFVAVAVTGPGLAQGAGDIEGALSAGRGGAALVILPGF